MRDISPASLISVEHAIFRLCHSIQWNMRYFACVTQFRGAYEISPVSFRAFPGTYDITHVSLSSVEHAVFQKWGVLCEIYRKHSELKIYTEYILSVVEPMVNKCWSNVVVNLTSSGGSRISCNN